MTENQKTVLRAIRQGDLGLLAGFDDVVEQLVAAGLVTPLSPSGPALTEDGAKVAAAL